ncbi:hypothetical protein [Acinetobacter baumannii]|uniref:hypothetical protein n=1 Tax=Acinetobacter baumannii TaxID=470 RepID=UPI003B42E5E1
MDKCREEFEKIEWVKDRLKYVWWSQNNEYCDTGKHPRANASFLNGALHLFREQQAKVEEQAQEIANLKSLIQGHELRHQQNLSIKQKLTRRSEELQKQLSEYIFVAETIDEMYVKEVQKSDELQKRIAKALKIQDEFDDQDDVRLMMYAVEQALKGEG